MTKQIAPRTFQPLATRANPSHQLAGLIPDRTGGWLTVATMAAAAAGGAYYGGKLAGAKYAPAAAALMVPLGFIVGGVVFDR
jgi:hypothetical protein